MCRQRDVYAPIDFTTAPLPITALDDELKRRPAVTQRRRPVATGNPEVSSRDFGLRGRRLVAVTCRSLD
jgi:hypothetical protein